MTLKYDPEKIDKARVAAYLRNEFTSSDIGTPEWADRKAELWMGLNKDEVRFLDEQVGKEGELSQSQVSMDLLAKAERYAKGTLDDDGELDSGYLERTNKAISIITQGALLAAVSIIASMAQYADKEDQEEVVRHALKTLRAATEDLLNDAETGILEQLAEGGV